MPCDELRSGTLIAAEMRDVAPTPSVRRALFGPLNHGRNRRLLDDTLSRIRNEQRLRWNFDFENETPLVGRFHWKTPDGDSDADAAQPSSSSPPSIEDASATTVVGEMDDALQATPAPGDAILLRSNAADKQRLRQTAISDYMPQRKRLASGEERPGGGTIVAAKVLDSSEVIRSSAACKKVKP